jgi:hypothetical protein
LSALIIARQGDDPENTYIGVYILFMAAFGSGMSISNAPDVKKAREAASKIFEVIDEPSLIDVRKSDGHKIIEHGKVEF